MAGPAHLHTNRHDKGDILATGQQHDMQDTSSAWPEMVARTGGEARLFIAFAACYLLLVWLGYLFKTGPQQLTVMWPAVGLLLAALVLAPLRRWPVLIAIQLAAEYAVSMMMLDPSTPGGILLFMLANTADAVVGALLVRSRLWRFSLVRVALALQFMLASAAGAAVSATMGAGFALLNYEVANYWQQWQFWWAGNWLGSLAIAPPVIFWSLQVRRMYPSLRQVRYWELLLLGAVLALVTWFRFRAPMPEVGSLLHTPALLLGVLLAVAFRLPPRFSSVLAMGSVLMAAALGASHPENIIGDQPLARMLVLQSYLILMASLPLIVGMLVTSMRVALDHVSASESRYRNFIELSSEAVWRIEVQPPMPVDLPQEEQPQWIRRHARVAESNVAFDRFSAGCTEDVPHTPDWEPKRSWCALYERHFADAAAHGYSLDGLRLNAEIEGRQRTFIISYSGVVEDGELRRIWCVGRDVSEIVDLNTRLLRERERLKAYAHQLVTAEERARRATAVDLHDGIGQSLTGMAMSLEVARMQAPQVAPLLDDIRANLRRVQERTRTMIADLSPPGLYELGLTPALQWLVVHFRSQDKLRVQLHCDVKEEAISMDLRVLIFKLVRELLRNVVKHSGVDTARVNVRGDTQKLTVEVTDTGRGFEWQMEMFGPRPGSFGLWSVSDRVADFGGKFTVDTAPGQGARFTLEFPLVR